jgi:hypothetical protein
MTALTGRPPYQKGQTAPRAAPSQDLRASAKGEDCTLRLECCTFDPSRTVLAHIRQYSGTGMAQKPPDWWAIYACDRCHAEQERLFTSDLCGADDVLRALFLTGKRMREKGLKP